MPSRRAASDVRRVEADDAGAAAADVRLDDDGKAQPLGGGRRLRRVVDDAGARIRQAERFEQRQLRRLGDLGAPRLVAVDDPHAEPFEVRQVLQRVEGQVAAAAQVGRRTHAVEDDANTADDLSDGS